MKKTVLLKPFSRGVTIVELLVVMGLLAVFFSLTVVNLTSIVPRANVTSTVDQLVADLKQQQMKAMSGETGVPQASGEAQPHGVHIDANQYVLYSGILYDANSASNAAVELGQGVELSTTFPSGNILFHKGSGNVDGYSSDENATITVTDTTLNMQRVIQLNALGVIVGVN